MIAWLKKNYPYFGTLMGAFMIPYVLITTPSFSESQQRFGVMKSDMRKISENGGIVVFKKEVNKYGVADLSVGVFAGSLPSDVRKKNALTMATLGWAPINQYGDRYCKDGMLYASYFSDETYDNSKVLIMEFRFTSQTIDECNKRQSV